MLRSLRLLKRIERSAYPACYRQMQECSSMDDVLEYCEAQDQDDLVMLTGKSWYFLAVKSTGEIVDLAGKTTLADLFMIKRKIKEVFSGRVLKLDAREDTSFRLIRKVGRIISDHPYPWDGETFHEMWILV